MYAEIKSTDKILINRLDENEKVLLETIVNGSSNKDITLEKIYGEDGEFGGVFVKLTDKVTPTESDDTETTETTETTDETED